MVGLNHAFCGKDLSKKMHMPICSTECTHIFDLKTKLDAVLEMLPFKLIRSRVHITTEQAHNPPQILAQTPLSNLTINQKTYRHFGVLNMGEKN